MSALCGSGLAAYVSRASQQPWSSSPVCVDVVTYANWAGAYAEDNPSHIIVSSSDAGNQDDQVLVHECCIRWMTCARHCAQPPRRVASRCRLSRLTRSYSTQQESGLTRLPDYIPMPKRMGVPSPN